MQESKLFVFEDNEISQLLINLLGSWKSIEVCDSENKIVETVPATVQLLFPEIPLKDGKIILKDSEQVVLFSRIGRFLKENDLSFTTTELVKLIILICELKPVDKFVELIQAKVQKYSSWGLLQELLSFDNRTELFDKFIQEFSLNVQMSEIWQKDIPDIFLNTPKGRTIFCRILKERKVDPQIGPLEEKIKLDWLVSQIDRLVIDKQVNLKGVYDLLATIDWYHIPRREGRIQLAVLKGLYPDFVEPQATHKMKFPEKIPETKIEVPKKSRILEHKSNSFIISGKLGVRNQPWILYTTDEKLIPVEMNVSQVSRSVDGRIERAMKVEPTKRSSDMFYQGKIKLSLLARTSEDKWVMVHRDRSFEFRRSEKGQIKPLFLDLSKKKIGRISEYKLVLQDFSWENKKILIKLPETGEPVAKEVLPITVNKKHPPRKNHPINHKLKSKDKSKSKMANVKKNSYIDLF